MIVKRKPILLYFHGFNTDLKKDDIYRWLIKYLPEFNDFCNYMIDHYSLKISRIEANNAILKKYENEQENNQLKNFISSWNNIYKDANLYNGKEVEQKSLSSNDKIILFLNDKKKSYK